jgi:hypothetical protein
MRLRQCLDHFRVTFLGCAVKRCVTILWGDIVEGIQPIVTIITYTIYVIDVGIVVN